MEQYLTRIQYAKLFTLLKIVFLNKIRVDSSLKHKLLPMLWSESIQALNQKEFNCPFRCLDILYCHQVSRKWFDEKFWNDYFFLSGQFSGVGCEKTRITHCRARCHFSVNGYQRKSMVTNFDCIIVAQSLFDSLVHYKLLISILSCFRSSSM